MTLNSMGLCASERGLDPQTLCRSKPRRSKQIHAATQPTADVILKSLLRCCCTQFTLTDGFLDAADGCVFASVKVTNRYCRRADGNRYLKTVVRPHCLYSERSCLAVDWSNFE